MHNAINQWVFPSSTDTRQLCADTSHHLCWQCATFEQNPHGNCAHITGKTSIHANFTARVKRDASVSTKDKEKITAVAFTFQFCMMQCLAPCTRKRKTGLLAQCRNCAFQYSGPSPSSTPVNHLLCTQQKDKGKETSHVRCIPTLTSIVA